MSQADQSSPGRTIVRGVALTAVLASATVIIVFNLLQGPERLVQQSVRFGLTCVLAYFLVRGAPWSRWVSVVLFALAGVGSAFGGLALSRTSAGGWGLVALGAVYLGFGALLLFPTSVRQFFSRAA